MKYTVTHLYPKHMSLYGDRGNIIVLSQRAKDLGFELNVQDCVVGEKIDSSSKLIMLGGGQDHDQEKVISDLLQRENEIKDLIAEDYIKKIHALYSSSEFPKNADFCTYWFRKAHQSSAERIGLVGTNSISQGQSRGATLSYVVENDGIIHDAVSTQEWSGEAAVHVSIVNWVKPHPQPLSTSREGRKSHTSDRSPGAKSGA